MVKYDIIDPTITIKSTLKEYTEQEIEELTNKL